MMIYVPSLVMKKILSHILRFHHHHDHHDASLERKKEVLESGPTTSEIYKRLYGVLEKEVAHDGICHMTW